MTSHGPPIAGRRPGPRRDHHGAPIDRGGERMIQKGSIRARLLVGLAPSRSSPRPARAPARRPRRARRSRQSVHDRLSPTAAASATAGARRSICSAKAQAVSSGKVSAVTVIHHDTDAAGQLTDIRDLIAQGRQRDHHQPERPGRAQPGHRRGDRRRHHGRRDRRLGHRPGRLQPVQRPGRSTPTSAPSGCSSRWARRATSSTCAASPATRPTPTATRASRRRSPSTRTSRSPRRS